MVREIIGLVAGLFALVAVVWLGILLGLAGMWWPLGLLGGALILGAGSVWATVRDPEREAAAQVQRAQRAGPVEGRTFDGRRAMPQLPRDTP